MCGRSLAVHWYCYAVLFIRALDIKQIGYICGGIVIIVEHPRDEGSVHGTGGLIWDDLHTHCDILYPLVFPQVTPHTDIFAVVTISMCKQFMMVTIKQRCFISFTVNIAKCYESNSLSKICSIYTTTSYIYNEWKIKESRQDTYATSTIVARFMWLYLL